MPSAARYVRDICRALTITKRERIVVLKVFLDESGTHEGSPVVAVGAYCGKQRSWEAFTRAWNAAKRPINVFHAVDCQNLSGEFKGWSPEDRDALVARLLPILRRHKLIGLAVAVNMKDLNQALIGREHLREIFGDPYAMCLHFVVRGFIEAAEKNNDNQSMVFIHEDNNLKKIAVEAFDGVKSSRSRHKASMTLAFGEKAKFVPLQAADVLAYEANKRGRDPSAKKVRRSLEALGSDRLNIRGFSKENMPWLISRLESIAEEIKTFGHVTTFLTDEHEK